MRQGDKPVNRKNGSVARLTAIMLVVGLVGLSSVACARHGSPAAPSSAATSQAAPAAWADPTASTVAGPESPSASPASAASPQAPATTPDPLDSELQALDQVVNDVNGSISSIDPGSSGGE
jgi:hypothetical protein